MEAMPARALKHSKQQQGNNQKSKNRPGQKCSKQPMATKAAALIRKIKINQMEKAHYN